MKRKNDHFWRGVAISELILFLIAVAVMLPILYLKKNVQCDVCELTTATVTTTTTSVATTAMMESKLTTTEDFKTTTFKLTTDNFEDTTSLNVLTETTQQLTQPSEMNIWVHFATLTSSYLINKDGSSKKPTTLFGPVDNFLEGSAYALVNGKFYIFGGNWDVNNAGNEFKIGYLDGCSFEKHPLVLNVPIEKGSIALSINNGQSAMVCFGYLEEKEHQCDVFDEETVNPLTLTSAGHNWGCLAHYNGNPTVVGGFVTTLNSNGQLVGNPTGVTETLIGENWQRLADHPNEIYGTTCMNIGDSLFLFGGHNYGTNYADIWKLKKFFNYDFWDNVGQLKTGANDGSSILIDSSVYIFGGKNLDEYSVPIHRVDFDGEDFVGTDVIGAHNGEYKSPVLYNAPFDFCV